MNNTDHLVATQCYVGTHWLMAFLFLTTHQKVVAVGSHSRSTLINALPTSHSSQVSVGCAGKRLIHRGFTCIPQDPKDPLPMSWCQTSPELLYPYPTRPALLWLKGKYTVLSDGFNGLIGLQEIKKNTHTHIYYIYKFHAVTFVES